MNLRGQLWVIIGSSVIAALLFHFTIRSSYPEWSVLYWTMVSLTCAQGIMSLGAGWFFLSGLRNFKPAQQKAYILLCIGVVAFGLSQAQLIPVSYLHAQWWLTNGLFTLPYMISFVFFFLGMRQFARVLGVKTRWTSWPVAVLTSVGVALILVYLPHLPSSLTQGQYATVVGFTTVVSVFFAFAAGAALRLRRDIGPLYTKALTWLAVGLIVGIIGGAHYVFVEMAIRTEWYYSGNITVIFMFTSSVLTLYAGYAVRQINEITNRYQPVRVSPDPLVFIEIVTYVSGLVSRPTEIDVVLDELRAITSQLDAAASRLSPDQEKRVIEVYHRIEAYLVSRERLRIYTRESLRKNVTKQFKLTRGEAERLWGV